MRTVIHYNKKRDIRVESNCDDLLIISESNLDPKDYVIIQSNNFEDIEKQAEKRPFPKLLEFNPMEEGCE